MKLKEKGSWGFLWMGNCILGPVHARKIWTHRPRKDFAAEIVLGKRKVKLCLINMMACIA